MMINLTDDIHPASGKLCPLPECRTNVRDVREPKSTIERSQRNLHQKSVGSKITIRNSLCKRKMALRSRSDHQNRRRRRRTVNAGCVAHCTTDMSPSDGDTAV